VDKLFLARDGNLYLLEIELDGGEIVVSRGIKEKGVIRLDYREGDPARGQPDTFHITHLALDNCKRLGIGRACLLFHQEHYGCPLTAGYADRGQAEDGSHLTGDRPGFIAAMRAQGIVLP
jgi:ribosomal protein S18 acetylase RimI-like enzyme